MQKGQALIFLVVGILIIAVVGGIFYLGRSTTPKPSPTPIPIQNSLKPIDSQTPASGICAGPINDNLVAVTFGMDNVPQPRCTKVTSNQNLKIINNSNQTISGSVGPYKIDTPPSQSQTIEATFGLYLMPGVHNIVGAEIWLQ